ncbi:hypothetical protein [uncultured Ramlibacter sp.]|uniref:hypothetical protein n=1 Tax=uncultured Ramlibacter sp. TaxID=260755 RepID=UPI00261955F5|nr:hypothetical protein [uncultured Ramlibacter sp.]
MTLKLFRSTGYSSILVPGETRVAMHPGWLVMAISLWVGLACNVVLWRALASGSAAATGRALILALLLAAMVGILLSLLGWRRTLKSCASLLVLLAAVAACAWWLQPPPADGGLWDRGSPVLPAGASLVRWQLLALLAALALPPMLWLRLVQVRRLPGSQQLGFNASGAVIGCVVLAASGYLLARILA